MARLFDIIGAVALLLFVAPLLAVATTLVALSGPGPVIVGEPRRGRAGRVFLCRRFRVETGRIGAAPSPGRPGLTPFGRLLRRSSIENLPQLFNVLAGDMRLVGPAPLPADGVVLWEVTGPASCPGFTGSLQL